MNDERILPKLRDDLTYREFAENGEKFIILYDPAGYARQPVAIPVSILPLLDLIDGQKTLADFRTTIAGILGDDFEPVIEPFVNLIEFMDYSGFLESENFHAIKEDIDMYLSAPVRMPVCTDNSYPSDPEELSEYLDGLFSAVVPGDVAPGAASIVVPHIDFRLEEIAHRCYASGYHALRDTDADLFVIFGTSHYGNSGLFMLSYKDYETPLGLAKNDTEVLDAVRESLSFELPIDDLAHRYEHSIEFQVVLLQHYFKDRDFRILPILTGSFHNFIYSGQTPGQDDRFNEFLVKLDGAISSKGRKAAYIASADMAHIGRKFNDEFDAEGELPRLREQDRALIGSLERCDADSFFRSVADVNDSNKICGLSPIYSLLKINKPTVGRFLNYEQWNEIETRSAVSFASMAFYRE